MQQNQKPSDNLMNADFLSWRIINQKKRANETKRNKEYNLRPRLRSIAHH